jgi:tripartite-type tricarboxylate transporter receptor subunit TctC
MDQISRQSSFQLIKGALANQGNRLAWLASILLLAFLSLSAQAQEYPSRPINLVVGFPPGGSNDIVARILAPKFSELIGAPVVVVNKPGSNALIGTDYVAKSAPDGYTITLGSASPLVISPHTYAKMPFDVFKDLVGITTVASTPELLVINPGLPVKNLTELIALSKKQQITLASSGNGGLPHLAIELLRTSSKGDFLHVPYKGAAPGIADVVGGHANGIIMDLPALYQLVADGRLKPIATLDKSRAQILPDLPTSVEQGAPMVLAFNWFGVMAPSKTPKPIIDKLFSALVKTAQTPDVKEALLKMGIEPFTSASPEAFTAFLQNESARWGKFAKESGARAD